MKFHSEKPRFSVLFNPLFWPYFSSMLGTLEIIGEFSQSPFNAGFLTHVILLRAQELAYVHAPGADTIAQPKNAIGIQPGAIITEFRIKPKTATFTESLSVGIDGESYQASLSFPMKGSLPALTDWIYKNGKRRYAILTRDTMGNCYLIGAFDNGARLSWSRQASNSNAHQISLSLVNWHPVQFIPTLNLEDLFPHREFDYSFDLSFS